MPENSGDHLSRGFPQQPLLSHLPRLATRRAESLSQFLQRRSAAQRRSHVQIAILELLCELPDVHLAYAQDPRQLTARPFAVDFVAPPQRQMPDQLAFRFAAPWPRPAPAGIGFRYIPP